MTDRPMLDNLRARIAKNGPLPPVAQLIGFTVTSADPGRVVVELIVDARHINISGTVHGGILCDIADAAMGLSFATTFEEKQSYTTIELKINYLRPMWEGRLRAIGTVVHAGRTIGLTECEIVDDDDRLMAKASSTLMILRGDQAKGR
jgi:uncharacterized protein (TIGR00369 family)